MSLPIAMPRHKRRLALKSQIYDDLLNAASLMEGEAWREQLTALDLDYDDFGRVMDEIYAELDRRALRLAQPNLTEPT